MFLNVWPCFLSASLHSITFPSSHCCFSRSLRWFRPLCGSDSPAVITCRSRRLSSPPCDQRPRWRDTPLTFFCISTRISRRFPPKRAARSTALRRVCFSLLPCLVFSAMYSHAQPSELRRMRRRVSAALTLQHEHIRSQILSHCIWKWRPRGPVWQQPTSVFLRLSGHLSASMFLPFFSTKDSWSQHLRSQKKCVTPTAACWNGDDVFLQALVGWWSMILRLPAERLQKWVGVVFSLHALCCIHAFLNNAALLSSLAKGCFGHIAYRKYWLWLWSRLHWCSAVSMSCSSITRHHLIGFNFFGIGFFLTIIMSKRQLPVNWDSASDSCSYWLTLQ